MKEDLKSRLASRLLRHLGALMDAEEAAGGDARLERRMMTICRVLSYLEGRPARFGEVLEALESFAEWASANLKGSDREAVRRALESFLAELKSKGM